MRVPQLTTSIHILLLWVPFTVLASAPLALAETERERAAKMLVEPIYPIWLAQAKAWTSDMQLMKSMTEMPSAVWPQSCRWTATWTA